MAHGDEPKQLTLGEKKEMALYDLRSGMSSAAVALKYNVSRATAYRWRNELEPGQHRKGRRPLLTPEQMEELRQRYRDTGNIPDVESALRATGILHCSESTLRRLRRQIVRSQKVKNLWLLPDPDLDETLCSEIITDLVLSGMIQNHCVHVAVMRCPDDHPLLVMLKECDQYSEIKAMATEAAEAFEARVKAGLNTRDCPRCGQTDLRAEVCITGFRTLRTAIRWLKDRRKLNKWGEHPKW